MIILTLSEAGSFIDFFLFSIYALRMLRQRTDLLLVFFFLSGRVITAKNMLEYRFSRTVYYRVDSVLIQKYMGQRNPVFLNTLRSVSQLIIVLKLQAVP